MLLILFVPIGLAIEYDNQQKPTTKLFLVWLLGFVKIKLSDSKKTIIKSKKISIEKSKHKKSVKKDQFNYQKIIRIILNPELMKQIVKMLWELRLGLRMPYMQVNVKFGLENPADTGYVYGLTSGLTSVLPRGKNHYLVIHPHFDEELLQIKLKTYLEVRLYIILFAIFKFVVSKELWRAIRNNKEQQND